MELTRDGADERVSPVRILKPASTILFRGCNYLVLFNPIDLIRFFGDAPWISELSILFGRYLFPIKLASA